MTATRDETSLEVREFEIRKVDQEAREVSGIAVPYGDVIRVGWGGKDVVQEKFEKGAFADTRDGVMLFYGHSDPIGLVTALEEKDEGLESTARISETARGDEIYTLLKDKVLRKFSVGFFPVESRLEGDTDDPVTVRTKVDLREVSVVPIPAYDNAKVSEVRSGTEHTTKEEENVVTDDTTADLRETVTELERQIATMRDNAPGNEAPVSQFRTGGEFLKALARGDEAARTELRDFGTTVEANADARPAWLSRPLKLKDEKRRILGLFSTAPLPAEGMSVEYPFVASTTGTVEEQVLEGDALTYMEVALDTGSQPVKTYGGYSSLSRQAIERSDLAYLDAVLRFQALQYIKATEVATKAYLTAATGTNTATLAADTVDGWIDVVIDGTAAIEDNSLGLLAEFMVVSRDVFKAIAHKLDASDRPVFAINGDGANTVGSANIVKASANIGGLPVVVDATLAAASCWIASSESITTLESPGAPFRLADESIVNLTKDFSLYGYMAHTLNDAKGLTKVDVSAVGA